MTIGDLTPHISSPFLKEIGDSRDGDTGAQKIFQGRKLNVPIKVKLSVEITWIGEGLLAMDVVSVQGTTTWICWLKEKEVSHPVSISPGEGREFEQSASDASDEVRVNPVAQDPPEDFLCVKSELDRFFGKHWNSETVATE